MALIVHESLHVYLIIPIGHNRNIKREIPKQNGFIQKIGPMYL
jgi:hypothetical protein